VDGRRHREQGPAALFHNDPGVDACFANTPDMAALCGGLDKSGSGADGTVRDARVLISTAHMKRSIADVYACRKDFYDAHRESVENFAAAYLKECEELVSTKASTAKGNDKDAAARYRQVLQMTKEIYGKEAIPKEEDGDGRTPRWLDVASSPWVLLPFTVGISAGVAAWLLNQSDEYIVLPCLIGVLVAVGAAATVRVFHAAPVVDGDIAGLRRQLLDALDAGGSRTGGRCQESGLVGTPAQADV
jgi:hypothetical protein